ncbi:Carbohydrate sulfotransferase [Caenorhabditis elegans]|uniref:Carbohydrate sulfotransferase n=1 Tax=Caenorhabditis elegans TaxID=6239 RepID=Q93792_CAEEL|nr:Carbohydrate sulfotransferase [Caenorhabditis elegans]CAB02123.3 Carbohydrate sulfotransferase [Caenorhabditis elegans]|eukprot:NP_506420.3 Uncharacterized protein CELE_F55B12.2 [Caenorhabditis elegans]
MTKNGHLFLLTNLKIVRKQSADRSKNRIIFQAFAINFIVILYYYGMASEIRQLRDNHLDFIQPYVNIRSDLFIAPKYKILSCGIRKSMSQLLINIMCLLHNETEFQNQNRSLNDTWMSERVCSHKDPEFHIPQKNVEQYQNLTKFAFIRDPFDRFISFYLHVCKNDNGCWDCGDNMRCVVRNVYKSLKSYENDPDEASSSSIDRHAAPITWNCNFQETFSQYHLIKIGFDYQSRHAAITQLTDILYTNRVSDTLITKISNESMTGETLHGTHKSVGRVQAEQQVNEDSVVREYLHKIYFFDYLIFNFDTNHLDDEYKQLLTSWKLFK